MRSTLPKLPLIPFHKSKFGICLLLAIYFFAAYILSNRYFFGQPNQVPALMMDGWFEFSPYWIWPYIVAYPVFPFTYYVIKDNKTLNHFCYSFFLLVLLSCSIFVFFPTAVQRTGYPINGLDALTTLAFEILRDLDKPTNCAPSLHVGTAFLSAFILGSEKNKYFWPYLPIAIMITLSTFYIKQHLTIDAIAGGSLALICFLVVRPFLGEKNG